MCNLLITDNDNLYNILILDLVVSQAREARQQHEEPEQPEEETPGPSAAAGSLFAKVKRRKRSSSNDVTTQYHQYISATADIEDVCAFKFWSEFKQLYPTLAKLALTLLKVPASSAPVERVFSKGSLLMRPHRCTLGVANLEKIVFLQCNE